jgi:hypothetical protein
MRITGIVVALAVVALPGCNRAEETQTATHHGRYLGIGVYSAGRMWSQMVQAGQRPAERTAATTADDEQVIVVVDSHTGEVRQCGNLTGYCIGMNPWSGALGQPQTSPIRVRTHAADLDREAASAEAADVRGAEADAAASRNQSR